MREVKIHVGEDFDATARRAAEAWRRAEKGEAVREDHIVFADWDLLAKVMTNKRYELLRHLHHHPAASVAALARALGRDYKRVHQDVEALASAGLLQRESGMLHAAYQRIESRITLA